MALQLTEELNPEQADAAAAIHGPLLIIAGAGSGKTRMITYRIAYMLEQGIPQSEILALTFTNKAAEEMAERIQLVTGRSLKKLTASTFHAFGLSVLKKHGTLLGYAPRFTIYDQQDQMSMLKAVLTELKIDPKETDLYELAGTISAVKTGRTQFSGETLSVRPIFEEYNAHLKLYNAVDFDDLIMQPLALFAKHPEVLEYYRKKFQYILVDEFQDTSLQQYAVVKQLAEKHRNICVVGDDDQSIYSWRGADYRNIVKFEEDFPECREIKLEQNYRSTGSIIKIANSLISNNTNRKDKNLWTGTGNNGIIALFHPEDEQEEADFIGDKIRELLIRHQLRYDNFGVLVRTNNLITGIERAFLAASIPYKVSGGQSFFQRKEIKDIISYLRILANPDDDMSLLRVINTPRRGIGKSTLEYLRGLSENHNYSLFSAMTAVSHAADISIRESIRIKVSELVDHIENYRRLVFSSKKFGPVVSDMLSSISYKNHIIAEHPGNENLAQWKMKNIDIFINIINNWENNPDSMKKGLYDFLNSISLKGKSEPDQERGKVNLMTIHASKGLEFQTVFLAGVEDHIIPHKRAIEENPESIEEERRLFYVAITRARENLFMTSARTRKVLREQTDSQPSRFLEELPKDVIGKVKEDTIADSSAASDYFAGIRARLGAGRE